MSLYHFGAHKDMLLHYNVLISGKCFFSDYWIGWREMRGKKMRGSLFSRICLMLKTLRFVVNFLQSFLPKVTQILHAEHNVGKKLEHDRIKKMRNRILREHLV